MRADWKRSDGLAPLDDREIEDLFRQTFPDARLTRTQPATGGLSNTNIKVWIDLRDAPLRLRLFHRGSEVAELEHAVSHRLGSEVPLPRCHVASSRGPDGRPYAIYDWVAGERLENAVLDHRARSEVGHDIGRTLATIHRVRFDRTGFLNGRLEVGKTFDASGAGLRQFARSVLDTERGRERLGTDFTRTFLEWLDRTTHLLDRSDLTAVLCHGDFGASNLIVHNIFNNETGRWRLAAVFDWEYACAGTPVGDLGNLLRPPLDTAPGFEQAVIDGYRSAGGSLPANWKDLALLSDLFAWIEFLGRAALDDAIAATARSRMAFTMQAVRIGD